MGKMDGFEDVFGALLDAEMAEAAAFSGLGGAAGSLAYAVLTDVLRTTVKAEDVGADKRFTDPGLVGKKMPVFDTPMRQALAAAGLLLVGGRALWEVNEDAAKGHVGAMTGQLGGLLYDLVAGKRTVRMSVKGPDDAATEALKASARALQQSLEGGHFAGLLAAARLSDPEVFDQNQANTFADAEVGAENYGDDDDQMDLGVIDAVSSAY